MEIKEPYIITESKQTFKDVLIKLIKLQRKPMIIKVGNREASEGRQLTANIVTEISRKKDKQVIKVKTNISTRYLLKI